MRSIPASESVRRPKDFVQSTVTLVFLLVFLGLCAHDHNSTIDVELAAPADAQMVVLQDADS